MPSMVEVKCKRCKKPFMARVADRKRGWGKFCSKSCKASAQESRTGQHYSYLDKKDEDERPSGAPGACSFVEPEW